MGAWDYGALDNDAALDVSESWSFRRDLPLGEAVDRFISQWGDALSYGDATTNMEVIALSALVRNAGQELPPVLRGACEDAINRELLPDALSVWADPLRRETALLAMLKDVNGVRREPCPPAKFNASQIHFANTEVAHRELMRTADFVRREGYLGLVDLMLTRPGDRIWTERPHELAPGFLRALHRLMKRGLAEADSNLADQAYRERRMMAAWYLGVTSLMSLDEIETLIKRVEGKGF